MPDDVTDCEREVDGETDIDDDGELEDDLVLCGADILIVRVDVAGSADALDVRVSESVAERVTVADNEFEKLLMLLAVCVAEADREISLVAERDFDDDPVDELLLSVVSDEVRVAVQDSDTVTLYDKLDVTLRLRLRCFVMDLVSVTPRVNELEVDRGAVSVGESVREDVLLVFMLLEAVWRSDDDAVRVNILAVGDTVAVVARDGEATMVDEADLLSDVDTLTVAVMDVDCEAVRVCVRMEERDRDLDRCCVMVCVADMVTDCEAVTSLVGPLTDSVAVGLVLL